MKLEFIIVSTESRNNPIGAEVPAMCQSPDGTKRTASAVVLSEEGPPRPRANTLGSLLAGGGGGRRRSFSQMLRQRSISSGSEPEPAAKLACSDSGDIGPLQEGIDVQATKKALRSGRLQLDSESRAQLWRAVCAHQGADMTGTDPEYRDTVLQMEGEYGPARGPQPQRAPFLHPFYTNHYRLEGEALWTAERVLAVLHYNHPAVTFSPPIYSICCLLLHHLSEVETYNVLCMMLTNSKLGYLIQTRKQCEIAWRTLVKLCRKHARGSMRFLQKNTRHGENVRHVLADWITWLFCFLPYQHVVRLFDCYLMEGEKVLYRAAMALVVLLHKKASGQSTDGRVDSRWVTLLCQQPVQKVMQRFCQEIPLTPRKLLKAMFNIRSFSRGTLAASYLKAREQIRDGGGRLHYPEKTLDKCLAQAPHHKHGLPSLESQRQFQATSGTIGVKEVNRSVFSVKEPHLIGIHNILRESKLSLIDYEELLQLWENLPRRFALYSPLLLYTSNNDGFSLKTFYQRVATYEPTVLLLRTTEGAVFGAYCSATWNTRNTRPENGGRRTYFGTGETFLFTLRPERRVYPWVGTVRQAVDPSLSSVSRAEQLFMAADNTMITVGGGGGQAIWLDENLSAGRTAACDTFANPPLTPTGTFKVACMEAFGFAPT